MASSCTFVPFAIWGVALATGSSAVTAIDTRVAPVTVSVSIPVTVTAVAPVPVVNFAEITVVPVPTEVAIPVAAMVAVPGVAEAQVTWVVSTCVELSANVPVATKVAVAPLAIDGVVVVTAIDMRGAAVTLSVVMPTMAVAPVPLVAEMTDVPTAAPDARPAAVIEAVAAVADAQVTIAEMSCVVMTFAASLNVPVATNCCVVPFAIVGAPGVTAIETSVAVVTVSVVCPTIVPLVAEITDVPPATPVARPAAVIVAVAAVADAQVAVAVRSFVVVVADRCPSP